MDEFSRHLNNLIVDTFRSILKIEEKALKSSQNVGLSMSEIHMIEAVGKAGDAGAKLSDIADDLGITLPSVTISINKLASKGYIEKLKHAQDGRVVYAALTEKGRRIEKAHRYFHEQLVNSVTKELSEPEKTDLLKGVIKLNNFFKHKLEELEK